MAKKGTLVVRFIGDVKEFEQANKKMGTDLTKTGKAIDSSLTQPFGEASKAGVQVGKDFTDSQRKMSTALSGTKRDIDSSLTKPLGDVSKAVQGLGGDMSTEMGKFDSAVSGSKRELDMFKKDLDTIRKKTISPRVDVDTAKAEGEMKSFFSRMSSKAKEAGDEAGSGFSDSLGISLKGGLAGVAAGAGVATAAGFLASMDAEASSDKLAASLGLSPQKAEQAGKVASKVYAGAWGDSLEDVNMAVGAVISSLPGMRNASDKALTNATIKAEDFATAFDVDITRAVQIAGQTVRTGFAKNAAGAFDLLVKASQKVPAAVREDLLDAVDEYGPFLQTLGFDGEQAFGVLAKGAEKGMYGIDKTGDALKEFTLLATDMTNIPLVDTLDAMGLNAAKTQDALLKGGKGAHEAFEQIVQGLIDIKDPSEQAASALRFFGTPLEDMNKGEIPKFLEGLTEAGSNLGKVEGASKRMGATLNDNAKTNLTSFIRQLKIGFVQVLGGTVIPVVREFSTWLATSLGPTITDIVDAFKRNWPQIKTTVLGVLGEVGGAIKDFVELVRVIWAKWGDDITRIVKTNFGGLADFVRAYLKIFRGVVQTITALIKGDWGDVWKGIKMILAGVWEAMEALVGTYLKQIRNIIDTQWDAVKDIFGKAWTGIKSIVGKGWDWVKDTTSRKFGDVRQFIGNTWGAIRDNLSSVWQNGIKPVFEALKDAVGKIPDAFRAAKSAIHSVWSGVKDVVKAPIKIIFDIINTLTDAFDWVSSKVGGPQINFNPPKGYDEGGWTGPGPKMRPAGIVHADEFVMSKSARGSLERSAPGALDHMNATGQWPGYAKGGKVKDKLAKRAQGALSWARSQRGADYRLGAVGPGAYDCSGFMSAITNFLLGRPLHRRVGSTGTFPWPGFVPGTGTFTIGSTSHYPGSSLGHMAGTLLGVNVESRGGEGVVVGPGARGYNDPGFSQVYHLAKAGALGGALGFAGGHIGFPLAAQIMGLGGKVTGALTAPASYFQDKIAGRMDDLPNNVLGGMLKAMPSKLIGALVEKMKDLKDSVISQALDMAGSLGLTRPGEIAAGIFGNGPSKGAGHMGHGDTGALSGIEKYIIRREAGSLTNVNANNPSSTAFGLGQLTEANRIAAARALGYPVGIERGDTGNTNRDHQIQMMRYYIKQRYGTQKHAYAFHRHHGFYDTGGVLPPGGIAMNGGTRNEYVHPMPRARRNDGGSTHAVIEVDGQQLNAVIRDLVREEVHDEFAYQHGGV